jgi:hypothetical protein
LLDLTAVSARLPVSAVLWRDSLVRNADQDTGSFANALLRERFSRWTRPLFAVEVRIAPVTNRHASPGGTELLEKPGTFVILKTKTDDKHGWIDAGQRKARLILHARLLGLSRSFGDRQFGLSRHDNYKRSPREFPANIKQG